MNKRVALRLVATLLLALVTASCATVRGGSVGGAGDPCRVPPGRAVLDAALAPATWAPFLGALALQLGDADTELSDWAARETPLFGSTDNARDMSDVFYWTTVAAYGATAASAHVWGEDDGECRVSVTRRLTVGAASHLATSGATDVLKKATGRLRPDGSNDQSFPSAHSSGAAVAATLAGRNIEWTPLSRRPALWVRGGLAAAAVGTAWARVEGGRHYPSDVLAGLALGHFVGALLSDVFLGHGYGVLPEVALTHTARETGMVVRWSF